VILRKLMQSVLLVCALWSGSVAMAATRSEVLNGATCIPYPPYDTTKGVPYQHWLYLRETAFCHLTMSSEWTVNDLSYVLITGGAGLRARLCLHSGDFAVTCGSEVTLPSSGINWVGMPAAVPAYVTGAFVRVSIPGGALTTVRQLIPVWVK
jgi:hypothetical protein